MNRAEIDRAVKQLATHYNIRLKRGRANAIAALIESQAKEVTQAEQDNHALRLEIKRLRLMLHAVRRRVNA